MSLRWVALVGAIIAVVGFFLVFLPIFQNPALWSVPTTAPAPFYELPGFLLFILGQVILLYCLFVFMWRRRNAHPSRGAISLAIYKMSYKPAIAGVIVFLLARAATRVILPIPPSPIKLAPLLDIGTVILSIIACLAVAYYLVRYYDRIPFTNPILKSIVASTVALVILAVFATIASGNPFYFMVYILYEAATFTATGAAIGFAYKRFFGAQSPAALVTTQVILKRKWLYYVLVIAIIALLVIFGQYQYSLQPVSFRASDIHFRVSNGSVQVLANITNTSGPSIIQVDAAIDGLDAGVCGYGINTNQTMACGFQIIPLLSCSQLPQTNNHTLALSPYFGNGRMPTETYSFTNAQLGCS